MPQSTSITWELIASRPETGHRTHPICYQELWFRILVTLDENESMSSRLTANAALFVVLAGLFVYAQLNLNRLRVLPFGLDPCDAVMHFAVFTMLLGLIGSLLALLPYRKITYPTQKMYVLRSHQELHSLGLSPSWRMW